MRIDAYAHEVPEQYYRDFGKVYQAPAYKRHPDTAGFWDYDRRIEHLDEFGIDKQIVALGAPHFWPGIQEYATEETIQSLVEQANDEIRKVADTHPDRFIPVGTLPVLNDSLIEEAERCLDDLDMAGLQIYSNYDGKPVDTEELLPVYELAEKRDIPIWIHPQVHNWHDWTYEWGIDLALGWLFDTSLSLVRLVLSGLMERHEELNIITHHGGGLTPSYLERLKLFFYEEGTFGETPELFEGGYEELTKPIEEYYSRFYYDTVLYGSVPALKTVYEVFGADQMIFATDYPYGGHEGADFMSSNIKAMEELNIPQEEKDKINNENFQSLIS